MTMLGTVPAKAIEHSLHRLQLASNQLEGVTHQLLGGSSEQRTVGLRLQQVLTVYRQEIEKIGYVLAQGESAPTSPERLAIGLQVQEALNEISQI